MWNSRVTLTVLASVIVLVFMCSLVGAAYAPNYTGRRNVRLSQIAAVLQTRTAVATRAIGATQLAFLPTLTAVAGATQTEAARPTITPAAVVACPATVVGTGKLMYSVPGGGHVRDAVPLPNGTSITIIARLKDDGWLQVKTDTGAVGWLRSDALTPSSTTCHANVYDLSYLLGLANGRQVVADDTFVSNENGWTNAAGAPMSPVLSDYGDAQLIISTNSVDMLRPSNPRLQHLPAFELVTSFTRVNFVTDSYVGVRFRANNLTYYEVRILPDCRLVVLAVNQPVFSRPIDPGPHNCNDAQEDWLDVSFTTGYLLTVQLNDANPVQVQLNDPAGLYTGGGLELVVGQAKATFSFIVVTAPR